MRTHKFEELREKVMRRPGAPERLAEARRRTLAEIDAYRRTLAEVRRARSVTQQEVAATLGVSQPQVSRIENQTDLYLSTLERYIAAVGGELELTVSFADGTRVGLTLAEIMGQAAAEEA